MSSLISANKAAEKLGVPATTLRDWIRGGLVPRVQKVSNMWLVPDDIELEEIDTPRMGRPPKSGEKDQNPV